ncbi:MAG: ankyrin repeat domain-containing protein [Lentisphaeraceae bacterium]|nr:ankyrin repeat domain-containing protein [Lentisphaeraceae bacterium]
MKLSRKTVGAFIDASVQDQALAKQLLTQYPDLRSACWLGDEPIIHFLIIEDFVEAVRFCLENGFDVNQADGGMGDVPLIRACFINYTQMLELLLQHGADANSTSECFDTAVHCCIRNHNRETLQLLIKHGANLNIYSELDGSPVQTALELNDKEMVQFLVAHGASPDIPHGTSGTPIHYCIENWNFPMLEYLLQIDANPDIQSDLCDPPIHLCIENWNFEMLDILLTHRANPSYETNYGETIYDNWPNNQPQRQELMDVLLKHNIELPAQ